jgi:hypothetical protein
LSISTTLSRAAAFEFVAVDLVSRLSQPTKVSNSMGKAMGSMRIILLPNLKRNGASFTGILVQLEILMYRQVPMQSRATDGYQFQFEKKFAFRPDGELLGGRIRQKRPT